ncbi:MAG: preprotein translocase subunit SecG [Verrucomicrobia bacterium]|nr:MAG: preprotein translocase subunit SecG [Verrucomicrobiota bacterium]
MLIFISFIPYGLGQAKAHFYLMLRMLVSGLQAGILLFLYIPFGLPHQVVRFSSSYMIRVLLPFLLTLHVGVCVLLVIVVLMQRPRSEGLGAAFGGGMTENIFGAQTSHVLAKFTTYLGAIFFALTLLLAIVYAKSSGGKSSIQKEIEVLSQQLKVPAATPVRAVPSPSPEVSASPKKKP